MNRFKWKIQGIKTKRNRHVPRVLWLQSPLPSRQRKQKKVSWCCTVRVLCKSSQIKWSEEAAKLPSLRKVRGLEWAVMLARRKWRTATQPTYTSISKNIGRRKSGR
jgi:hypothetical protein